MTIRLQASVQPLVFVIMLAATLFGTAGRFDIIEFWAYLAIVAAVSALSLTILDADLMQERMRPGGRRVGWHFLPLISGQQKLPQQRRSLLRSHRHGANPRICIGLSIVVNPP